MEPISTQRYYKVQRDVTSLSQQDIELERYLYLYEDKIVSAYREFPLDQVTDISYREFGKSGLIYLHTFKGIFTYPVKNSPDAFINACKNCMNSH